MSDVEVVCVQEKDAYISKDKRFCFLAFIIVTVDLVLSPTYALIYKYIIKILSQAITLVALFTPTCFDPYGSSSGSTAGPC